MPPKFKLITGYPSISGGDKRFEEEVNAAAKLGFEPDKFTSGGGSSGHPVAVFLLMVCK